VVLVDLIVDETGHPRNVHVIRPLGMGLDARAVLAVSQYRFTPGMKKGRPVPVEMHIEVNFRLY
jgi:protein TonB